MTKVSILITTHNYGQYIKECLDSIAMQTYKDYYVIIVDDASTDGTEALLNEYQGFNYTHHTLTEQVGQCKAKNFALSHAKTDLVFFLDADNKFNTSDALQKFVSAMDKHPEAGFVYCDRLSFGDRDGIISSAPVSNAILHGNYIDGNFLVRREAFGEYDEFLVKLTDWDRILHMLTTGWIGIYHREPLIAYRFHGNNTGTVHMNRHQEMHEYIVKKYEGKKVTLWK